MHEKSLQFQSDEKQKSNIVLKINLKNQKMPRICKKNSKIVKINW